MEIPIKYKILLKKPLLIPTGGIQVLQQDNDRNMCK